MFFIKKNFEQDITYERYIIPQGSIIRRDDNWCTAYEDIYASETYTKGDTYYNGKWIPNRYIYDCGLMMESYETRKQFTYKICYPLYTYQYGIKYIPAGTHVTVLILYTIPQIMPKLPKSRIILFIINEVFHYYDPRICEFKPCVPALSSGCVKAYYFMHKRWSLHTDRNVNGKLSI